MATGEISVLNLPLKTGSDISSNDYFLFIDDGILSKILKTDLYASVAVDAKGDKGDVGATGANGQQGFIGWSPVLAVVSDGARRVVQVYDWTGSTGTKPATGQYISTTGFTSNISLATDIRGATGSSGTGGTTGTAGTNGWSPVLAVITDGARRVLQVYDWVGGTGGKPATGSYIGASGLTGVLASAVDVRGSVGATGATGAAGATGATGSEGANGTNGTNGADGSDAKQIASITHTATNAITTTFTDASTVTSDAPKRLLGWASYQDTAYTSGSPLTLADGIRSTLQNNSGTVVNSSIPTGVTKLYDNGTSKITPVSIGDGIHLSIRFMAVPSAVNTYLIFGVDIGGGSDIFQKTEVLPRGAGVANPVSIDVQGYALSTFIANGGLIKITAIGGNIQVYNVEFQIHRTSVA